VYQSSHWLQNEIKPSSTTEVDAARRINTHTKNKAISKVQRGIPLKCQGKTSGPFWDCSGPVTPTNRTVLVPRFGRRDKTKRKYQTEFNGPKTRLHFYAGVKYSRQISSILLHRDNAVASSSTVDFLALTGMPASTKLHLPYTA